MSGVNFIGIDKIDEMEAAWNSLRSDGISAFETGRFDDGIVSATDDKTIRKYFANPEDYLEKMEKLTQYYYMSNPAIFQLYDMTNVLPILDFKIDSLNTEESDYAQNVKKILKVMKKVRYRSLTREIITQTITAGTLCAIWVGTKTKPHLHVFNDLKTVFPAYTKDNSWVLCMDLKMLDTIGEANRENIFDILSPHVSEEKYELYQTDPKNRFIELPQKRSICIYTHKQFVNQRFGLPWATQSFYDVLHKEKLRALEKSIANRYINGVGVVTVGLSDDKGEGKYNWDKVGTGKEAKGKKAFRGIKESLQIANDGNTTLLSLPHWMSLVFPEIKTDGLDPDKFNSVNDDLNGASSGVINAINGKSNFSASKITIDIMYRKIAVLLELIEYEVFQKLINITLKSSEEDEYSILFNKKAPLTSKERIAVLEKLNSFGGSIKAIVDELEDNEWTTYLKQTMYEQEILKLPEKIKPYQSTHQSSGSGETGVSTEDVDTSSTSDTNKSEEV